jgi:hypothetical protein
MRTSNKLLIAFVAFVVLLMLGADVVMWANFKNGKTGDDILRAPQTHWKTHTLQPVKVVKVDSKYAIDITLSDKYELTYSDEPLQYSQRGDTLFLQPSQSRSVILKCPDIQSLLLSQGDVNIYNLSAENLSVQLKDSSRLQISDSKFKSLHITGATQNHFRITSGNTDSLYLQLGKGSIFNSDDVPYQFTSMKLDSLEDIRLTGRSMNALKEIK